MTSTSQSSPPTKVRKISDLSGGDESNDSDTKEQREIVTKVGSMEAAGSSSTSKVILYCLHFRCFMHFDFAVTNVLRTIIIFRSPPHGVASPKTLSCLEKFLKIPIDLISQMRIKNVKAK